MPSQRQRDQRNAARAASNSTYKKEDLRLAYFPNRSFNQMIPVIHMIQAIWKVNLGPGIGTKALIFIVVGAKWISIVKA